MRRVINYPFAAIPNGIARGGHGAFNLAVFCTLLTHEKVNASLDTLAVQVGCDRHTVQKAIKYWLDNGEKYGVKIKVTKRDGKTNVYHITILPEAMQTQAGFPLGQGPTQGENPLGVGGIPPRYPGGIPPTKKMVFKKTKEKDVLSYPGIPEDLGFKVT